MIHSHAEEDAECKAISLDSLSHQEQSIIAAAVVSP